MTWQSLPPELRELAERVCTAKELEALRAREAGAGYRRIALMLDISVSSARDRVQRALAKLERELR